MIPLPRARRVLPALLLPSLILAAPAIAGDPLANVNLTLTPASYSGCDDPAFETIDEGDCGDLASDPVEGPAFVWVVASPELGIIAGLQFGIEHSLPVDGWTLCTGGLEIPEEGWPASGTGNVATWPDNCYESPGGNARVGFFQVADGSLGTFAVTPDPRNGLAVYENCFLGSIPLCDGQLGSADLSVGTIPVCGTFDGETPAAPTDVTATTGECPVTITWTHDGYATTAFEVFRNGIRFNPVLGPGARSFTDPDAPRGVEHAYTVAARNACGRSEISAAASGSVPDLAPAAELTAEDGCDGPLLAWTHAGDPGLGFRIDRDDGWTATVDADVTELRDTTGERGVVHTYEIVAFDACGDVAPSNPASGSKLPLPEEPGDLTASDDLCDVIRVTWVDRALDEVAYEVLRDDVQIASLPADTETYDDADVDPGDEHEYRVRARNACGTFGTIRSARGRRTGAPPVGVTGLAATDDLCGLVRLSWTFEGVPDVEIELLRDGASLGVVAHDVSVFDDSTAVAGVPYTYTAQARNPCGDAPISNDAIGAATDAPPDPVTGCAASDDRCDGILVSWIDASDDETGFQILRDGAEVAAVDPDVTTWLDTGIDTNTTYDYAVVVTNACGAAEASDPDPGTWFEPELLDPPELLAPAPDDSCGVQPLTFRWRSVPDANGYRVRFGSSCGLDDLLALETSDTTATTALLSPGVVHWEVETANACDAYGAASTCWELDVVPPLGAPTILTGDDPDEPDELGFWNVSWEPVAGAERYHLRLSRGCHALYGYGESASHVVTGTDTTLDVNEWGTIYGIEFWAWVVPEACGALGDSTACIGPGCCGVPVLLEAFEGHSHPHGIELTWRTGGDRATDGFDLWRRDDRDPVLRRVTADPVDGNAFLDRTAAPGRTFTYELREVVPGRDGIVLGHTTVHRSAPPAGVTLRSSPNPFNPRTTLHVELGREARVVLEIYDPTGRLVRPLARATLAAGTHRVAWDGRDAADHALPSGIYYARLRADGVTRIERLALVR